MGRRCHICKAANNFRLGSVRAGGYLRKMKNLWSVLPLSFVVFIATVVYGTVPPINVTVSDGSGKVAFKGTTNASGTFATANLKPGNYVVQFNSSSGAMKGNRYAIAVSAGTQKASADAIPAARLAGAGVAMKITVGTPIADVLKKNPGLNNPAAIRAMERDNQQASLNITGKITAAP